MPRRKRTIPYHSLHDNKYLQYFKGHKTKGISLEVSPIDDGFMSGMMDETGRQWDLRTPTCRGLFITPSISNHQQLPSNTSVRPSQLRPSTIPCH